MFQKILKTFPKKVYFSPVKIFGFRNLFPEFQSTYFGLGISLVNDISHTEGFCFVINHDMNSRCLGQKEQF